MVLGGTLSTYPISVSVLKETFCPFNFVQLISLPKTEDKHHHDERVQVVSTLEIPSLSLSSDCHLSKQNISYYILA